MQIFEARVHARQQIRLLNCHALSFHFRERHHRFDFVRPGDVRDDSCQVELKLDGVFRVGISAYLTAIFPPRVDVGFGITGTTLRAAGSRPFPIRELRHARAQIIHRNFIKRKYACERTPLGRHVGDGHARRHGKMCDAIADKFNSVIEYFVFVEEPTQGDDHILADDTRRKFSFEHDLRDGPNLPPCHPGCPNTSRIGADDRCAQRGHCAV